MTAPISPNRIVSEISRMPDVRRRFKGLTRDEKLRVGVKAGG